jgi:bifunctional UDP-N-acetylglucosamine pyrophosphorylase/glucosamine-1-phosphate N-acetyltransferase
VVVVLAPGMDAVKQECQKAFAACGFAEQMQQKGTGDAVHAGLRALSNVQGDVLVVYGDTPLVKAESLKKLLAEKQKYNATIALLGIHPEDPTGYGRLVMDKEPFVERIVECKDATAEQKKIRWGWGGVMAFDGKFLKEALPKLQPSPATGEYYLTALLEMATAQGGKNVMVPMALEEAMGVNDRVQLAQAEAAMQQRLREQAMVNGATLIDPGSVFFSTDTKLGTDVVVHPFVVFGPNVKIGNKVEIRSYSHLEGASVAAGSVIGPFARLRPGTVVEEEGHVGNFVELKATRLGKGAKANHLSYIGDAEVGDGANIGAGTITCNYDGVNKYRTVIGEGAFIGSNSSLVAPVRIGVGAIVGAGSVITDDVADDALALSRAAQVLKPGKAAEMKKRQKK